MYDDLVNTLLYDAGWLEQGITQTERDIAEHSKQAADAIKELVATVGTAYNELANNEANKPRWIPVTEQKPPLPEDEDICFADVIAAIRGRKESAQVKYCRAYRYRDGKRECIERFIDDWEVVYVTHWMPLPEPPKEEKK